MGCGFFRNTPTIYIKEASFGNKDEGCVVDATKIVDYSCSAFRTCSITADIGIFGDPKCPVGVDKFLFVDYWCGTLGNILINKNGVVLKSIKLYDLKKN